MNVGKLFAVSTGVTVGLAFTLAVALAPPREDVGPPDSPVPTPTVTVTETVTVPQPYIPSECTDLMKLTVELQAAVETYEAQLGVTVNIQEETMQAILDEDYVPLNSARQELIDLQRATIESLELIHSLEEDLAAGNQACKEASTP